MLHVIRHFELPNQPSLGLSTDLLAKAGAAFQGVGEVQSQSGRWLKLTDESMAARSGAKAMLSWRRAPYEATARVGRCLTRGVY